MTEIKRIATGFIWNQIGKSLEYLFVFLFSALLARMLGSELYGIYVSLLSFVFLLSTISSFGLETSINATFPKFFGAEPSKATSTISKLLLFRFFSVLLISLLVYFFQNTISKVLNIPVHALGYFIFVVIFFVLRNLVTLLNSFFISFFKTQITSTISVSIRLLEIVFGYVFLIQGYGLREIFLLLIITNFIQLILLSALLYRSTSKVTPEKSNLKNVVSLGTKYWLNSILEFLFGKQAVILILGIFAINFQYIGNLDVSFSFAQAINFGLTIGFYGVSVSAFSTIEEKGKKILEEYWITLNKFVLTILVPAFVFLIIFAENIIYLVYSEQYLTSVLWFQIFSIVFLITRIIGGGLSADYLQSKGLVKQLLYSSLFCGLFNLISAPIFIYFLNIYGAIIALSVSNLLIAFIHYYYTAQAFDAKLNLKFATKILLIGLISGFLTVQINTIVNNFNLFVSLAIYITFILLAIRILRPLSFRDIEIISKVNPRIAEFLKNFATSNLVLTDRQKWAFSWLPESEIVLDVGCSNTPLINFLPAKSKTVVGVDIDLSALRDIKKKNTYLIAASAESLPFESETFDVVLMLDVLEHLDNDKLALAEAWRVLKNSGVLILSVPYKGLFSFLDPQNLSKKIKNKRNIKIHKHYSAKDLKKMFFKLFRIEKIHYGGLFIYPISFGANNFFKRHFGLNLARFWKKLGDIDNNISWGKLSYNVIIKARKI